MSSVGSDPQTEVQYRGWVVTLFRILESIVIPIGLFVSCSVIARCGKRMVRLNAVVEAAAAALVKEGFSLKDAAILFALACLANVYFLSTFSFSVDDEYAALRTSPDVWISQGRWTTYLVEKFLFPQPSIPYAPYVLLSACLAIGYMFILRAHALRTSWKTYLAYAVLCCYPTWWLISEFYSNIPSTALGFVLSSVAIYLWARASDADAGLEPGKRHAYYIWATVLAAVSIGSYQSFILYFLCGCAGVTLLKLRTITLSPQHSARYGVRSAGAALAVTAAAAVIYWIINALALQVSGQQTSYVDGFVRPAALFANPLAYFAAILLKQWDVYTGAASQYGAPIPLATAMLALSTISMLFLRREVRGAAVLIWLVILFIPFGLNVLAGADGIPLRSMIALSYVTWLMAITLLSVRGAAILLSTTAVVVVFQIQLMSVGSQYMAAATITQAQDRMLAADIYRRIGELDKNAALDKPIVLDVYGHRPVKTVYGAAWSSAIKGSFFEWDNGNLSRMVAYMRVMGYADLQAMPLQQRQAATSIFRDMPVWPAVGSVRRVDGKYYVRLSADPDPVHGAVR